MRNCQIQLFMLVKILQKNEFVENVWTANSALFIYVSTQCVETVKQLDYNRFSQLTRWCSGNAFALSAILGSGKGFYVFTFDFFVLLLLFFYFLPKSTLFVTKFYNSFSNVNLFCIFNMLQDFLTDYKGIKIQTQHL